MKLHSARESLFRASPVFAALAAVGFACTPAVPLQNRPCPCADGWVCCPSENVCAASADSCSGASGVGSAGTGGASDTGSAGAAGGAPPADAGLSNPSFSVEPSSLLGSWSGYVENYSFPSKSDSIRLSITQDGAGDGKVSIVLGMGPPPAPPTDPAAIWPGSFDIGDSMQSLNQPIEGFVYDAYEVRLSAGRLQFVIDNLEPYQPYCHLQTSYYHAADGSRYPDVAYYNTLPESGTSGVGTPDGGFVCHSTNNEANPPVVSCELVVAGDKICACNATGCVAQTNLTTSFDITFTGNKGTGSVTIDNGHDIMLTQIATAAGGQP